MVVKAFAPQKKSIFFVCAEKNLPFFAGPLLDNHHAAISRAAVFFFFSFFFFSVMIFADGDVCRGVTG